MWLLRHRFTSRGALWIIRIVLCIVAPTAIAWGVLEAGHCVDGFKSPMKCAYIPDQFGRAAFPIVFFGGIFSYFAALPLAGLALIWEVIAWLRKDP